MGCPDLGDTKWPVVQDILGKQTYDSLIYIIYIYVCMENHHVYWYITYKYNYRYITIYIYPPYIYTAWWCNLEKYESMGRMTSHISWKIQND